ncbi:MAG: SpaA isopeptide-forming pilin-related protein [Phocaeicola sp.]
MAKEVQQSQVAQEVDENKIEDNPTSKETPIENIGVGLQYVEQIENSNLTRGSPTITSTRVLDYGTGEYIYAVGYNAITVQSNGLNYNRLLTEILLNNELVFCIEPLILTDVGISYEVTPTDNYLSSAEKINLGLIGYFGYGYNGDTPDEMMAATQAMIWKYRGYGITDYKPVLQEKMNVIQHRMDTFTTRPSFEGQSLEFDGYGKDNAITLTDNNNVLSDFHIFDDGGYKIEKSGNSLKVWVEKGSNPAGTITLDRMNRDRIGNTVVWRNPDGKQTLANVRWTDPSSMKVKIRVAVGNIEITKKDDLGNTVKGTQFKVSTTADMKNLLGTYTTDDKGRFRIDDIPIKYQTLYYQEVYVPNPYVIDTTIRSIDVKYDTTTSAEVTNKHQKGTITIHKEDSETGTTPQGDATLSGWVFGLYADKDKES